VKGKVPWVLVAALFAAVALLSLGAVLWGFWLSR
jgi:hypothetical protein